ncbi:MAG: cell division protein FtsZ [Nitrospinae bacterium]|nr:cell division protein FtsZ [Nitrospinota bacterium]MBF0633819.1 cell division protein FtsZ [Nitrospinota bacterium]
MSEFQDIDDSKVIFDFDGGGQDFNFEPKIKVVGVGGGGGNAVRTMLNHGIAGVELIVANTDVQALRASPVPLRIQLGKQSSRGLGAGGKPEVGKASAMEDEEDVRSFLKDANMVFITAGMGGGTGTGAAPIIASIARELGALTVAVVTKPFMFEGNRKHLLADAGINELRKCVDTLIIIPNQQLLGFVDKKAPATAAFQKADGVLCGAVKGISDIITGVGGINVDFADVKTVMSQKGMALLGVGMGSGDMRAIEAAQNAINSPLLEDSSIEGARGLLINITGGPEFSLHEINDAVSHITEHADPEADIKFGFAVDEGMGEKVSVTVIATGFRTALEARRGDERKIGVKAEVAKVAPIKLATERALRNEEQAQTQQSERIQMRRPQLKAVNSDINYLDENLDIPSFIRRQAD